MIDAANPRDRDGHDIIIELVTNIKNFESQLIETISNVDQADLVDYAIKVNEDWQSTVKRFKQLQKGQKPDQYIQASSANNFIRPPEEEVKLEVTSDAMSDVRSIIR